MHTIGILFLIAWSTYDSLFACSVCGSQYNAKQAWAYLTMSMVFTAIPFIFALFIFFYLRRRAKHSKESP
ncbi:MAG: hypothetical protein LDLANPLL_01677 [Turneriella sp.]|nr:hypothetical protein [Turneriella sp.]